MKSLTAFFCFFLFVYAIGLNAQQQEVTFVFNAPEGEEILKEDHNKHEKSTEFHIKGLNTVEEVSELVEKIASVYGVLTFNVDEKVIDGMRAASATFDGCAGLEFFQKLLNEAGIKQLVVNGQKLTPDELIKVWTSRHGDEDPTKPVHDLINR